MKIKQTTTERRCSSTHQYNKKYSHLRFIEDRFNFICPRCLSPLDPGTGQDGENSYWRGETAMTPTSHPIFLGIRKCWNSINQVYLFYKWQKNVHFVFVCFYKSGPHFDEVDESFLSLFQYLACVRIWTCDVKGTTGRRTDSLWCGQTDEYTEMDRVC